jgi:hypothetical protein
MTERLFVRTEPFLGLLEAAAVGYQAQDFEV